MTTTRTRRAVYARRVRGYCRRHRHEAPVMPASHTDSYLTAIGWDPDDDRHLHPDDTAGDVGDYLRNVLAGLRLAPPTPTARGEYDPYRLLARNDKAALASAGWVRRTGLPADRLQHALDPTDDRNPDEFLTWYLDTALAAVRQARTARRPVWPMRRRDALATRVLDRPASYFALRTARAVAAGFPSYAAQRAANRKALP